MSFGHAVLPAAHRAYSIIVVSERSSASAAVRHGDPQSAPVKEESELKSDVQSTSKPSSYRENIRPPMY